MSTWNYAAVDIREIEVKETGGFSDPWNPEHSPVTLEILDRKTTLDITVKGKGSHVSSFTINGVRQKVFKVSATATGLQKIIVNVD